jgi:hypothetical protein
MHDAGNCLVKGFSLLRRRVAVALAFGSLGFYVWLEVLVLYGYFGVKAQNTPCFGVVIF